MTWSDLHEESEGAAAHAEVLARSGDRDGALQAYALAAEFEEKALAAVGSDKPRTFGILAISAASLWFKARGLRRAEALALKAMTWPHLPPFAAQDLRTVLQSVWTEVAKEQAGVAFLPGQVLVSVKGGEVVVGGAPLDLIVDRVKGIQSLFYRTIEYMRGTPLRKHGPPSQEIQSACKPWLFQEAPGSYQFSIAVQEPAQADFFHGIKPAEVVDQFLRIVEATASDQPDKLTVAVEKPEYRAAFLKLARNLAPRGKQFSLLEIKAADGRSRISLGIETQTNIKNTLRSLPAPSQDAAESRETVRGILRAVHLDADWLEVVQAGHAVKIEGLQDSIDDVIGPMVNRPVVVTAFKKNRKYRLIDIELDE
jgi:hypothetical protein